MTFYLRTDAKPRRRILATNDAYGELLKLLKTGDKRMKEYAENGETDDPKGLAASLAAYRARRSKRLRKDVLATLLKFEELLKGAKRYAGEDTDEFVVVDFNGNVH